ncbi:MAG: MFS transporter [Bacteroidales bacterium]|nr:MFS transporter [Bacteroidales bacterium]
MSSLEANIAKLYIIKASKWFMLVMPIYALFYKDNNLSGSDLILLQAVYSISIAFMEVPSGYAADVFGRKRTIVLGSILGVIGFVIYSIYSGFWFFLVAELILGLGQSFISGSDSALLYDSLEQLKKKDKYLKYEGRITALGGFAEMLAALVGGLVAIEFSLRSVFFIQSMIAFMAVPAALLLVEPFRENKLTGVKFKTLIDISKYALWKNKKLSSVILFSSVIGSATLAMAWLALVYYTDYIQLQEKEITIVWIILNATVAIVSFYADTIKKKINNTFLIFSIALVIPLGYLFLGFANFLSSIVVLFVFYVVRGYATPLLKELINRQCPAEIRATVLSVRSLIIRLLFAIVGLFIGSAFALWGVATSLAVCSIPLFVCVLASLWYMRAQQE